jgi:hypothetical protein
MTSSEASLMSFIQRTLCALQCKAENTDIKAVITGALERLIELGLVIRKRSTDTADEGNKPSDLADLRLQVTNLGRAVYRG